MNLGTDDNLLYRIAFSMIRGCNYGTARKMLSLLADEKAFFTLSDNELHNILNVRNDIVTTEYRHKLLEKAEAELKFVRHSDIHPVFFNDPDYPRNLTNCEDGPAVLYTLGNCDLSARKILSIVGTRRATAYGIDMTQRIVAGLAAEYGDGIVIVSGLAYGIDVAAHRAALAEGVPTIAVTAHPLNTIYPAAHRSVAVEILHRNGALITEYPTSSVVHRSNFLQRNRIIAGISDATLVVESDDKGGSLVTASIANAYERDVFAVPGRTTDRYSRGANRLIATNRAVMARDADDIINAMRWERRPTEGQQGTLNLELSELQLKTIQCIRENPEFTVNEISRTLAISYSELTTVLFELEMSDLIVTIPGNRYMLTALATDV